MLINDIILEINNYKTVSIHKSALHIYNLLESNKDVFVQKMSDVDFNHLHSNFERMSYTSPKEYYTLAYEREFKTAYDLLLFYINKII